MIRVVGRYARTVLGKDMDDRRRARMRSKTTCATAGAIPPLPIFGRSGQVDV